MEGKRFIEKIKLTNLLSFGPEGEEVELQPLNVLIGPNGSGKSNLIEAIGLLQALPTDLAEAIRRGGGIAEWLWKGSGDFANAEIETQLALPGPIGSTRHQLSFSRVGPRTEVAIEAIIGPGDEGETQIYLYPGAPRGATLGRVKSGSNGNPGVGSQEKVARVNPHQSALAQFRDPAQLPQITALAEAYSRIRIFRGWGFSPSLSPRAPAPADLPDDFLSEDASNLALVVGRLLAQPEIKQRLLEELRRFNERIEGVELQPFGNFVQLAFRERGLLSLIPANRVSDGTLRYLCLLTVLLHPSPPPLVCIEEPELGLHPDILYHLAELLVEAAERTQLIVTTHSEAIISALGETPEAVVVCERDDFGTHFRRLEPGQLKEFLEKYSLGELWQMGEIGGNPW